MHNDGAAWNQDCFTKFIRLWKKFSYHDFSFSIILIISHREDIIQEEGGIFKVYVSMISLHRNDAHRHTICWWNCCTN